MDASLSDCEGQRIPRSGWHCSAYFHTVIRGQSNIIETERGGPGFYWPWMTEGLCTRVTPKQLGKGYCHCKPLGHQIYTTIHKCLYSYKNHRGLDNLRKSEHSVSSFSSVQCLICAVPSIVTVVSLHLRKILLRSKCQATNFHWKIFIFIVTVHHHRYMAIVKKIQTQTQTITWGISSDISNLNPGFMNSKRLELTWDDVDSMPAECPWSVNDWSTCISSI